MPAEETKGPSDVRLVPGGVGQVQCATVADIGQRPTQKIFDKCGVGAGCSRILD